MLEGKGIRDGRILSFRELVEGQSDDLSSISPAGEYEVPEGILEDERNPVEKILDGYDSLPVRPFVRRENLNNGDDTAPEKHAWEIGVEIDF